MIRNSRCSDERREAGPIECWCLHGNVGLAADWREVGRHLASHQFSTRAVDLWRFLECEPMPLERFGATFNADAAGSSARVGPRVLVGYSMGGRLALHALLEPGHPWQAAVIIGAHPGLEEATMRGERAATDAHWAARALTAPWPEFLRDWEDQPVLRTTDTRDGRDSSRLRQRRREIARGFVDWSLGHQAPLWTRLPGIGVPVLWVVGEQDEKFRPLGERACQLIPRSSLAIAPGSGHRVPWQAAEWLAHAIARFALAGN